VPFSSSGGRDKRSPDFKDGGGLSAQTDISFEHLEQAADQARPQRNMVFAQRIAQLDRVLAKSGGASRNQFGCARFEKSVRNQPLAECRFQIVRTICSA